MDINKIKVGVRIRHSSSSNNLSSISTVSGKEVQCRSNKQRFEYDWAFDEKTSTRTVYELSCMPLIQNIFEGFNATFFACKLKQIICL